MYQILELIDSNDIELHNLSSLEVEGYSKKQVERMTLLLLNEAFIKPIKTESNRLLLTFKGYDFIENYNPKKTLIGFRINENNL